MSIRISLRGMLRLIWVDTLRRDHNVGFLEGQLILYFGVYYEKQAIGKITSRKLFLFSSFVCLSVVGFFRLLFPSYKCITSLILVKAIKPL